jgi:hypothetical protein
VSPLNGYVGEFGWLRALQCQHSVMKLRFLLPLLVVGLMVRSFAGLTEGTGEVIGKDLGLVSAEFGLVEQDADGTIHIKPTDKIPLVGGQTYG